MFIFSNESKIEKTLEDANYYLTEITLSFHWDTETKNNSFLKLFNDPKKIDLDVSAILLRNDKLSSLRDVVYFANMEHMSHSVIHKGRDIKYDGSNEEIYINLRKLPSDVNKIILILNIYDAVKRDQNFSMINDARLSIYNEKTGNNIFNYNISTDFDRNTTTLVLAELINTNVNWKIRILEQGTKDINIDGLIQRISENY